jgi:CheY-like chemotaxis protein
MSQTVNPLLLNALVKRLSNGPRKILAVKSRNELPVAVEQGVPDLVLIDINMPGRFQVPSATSEYGVTTDYPSPFLSMRSFPWPLAGM